MVSGCNSIGGDAGSSGWRDSVVVAAIVGLGWVSVGVGHGGIV